MSKIITFSQKFQKGHPKAGESTLFVEKILNQRGINYKSPDYLNILIGLNSEKLNDKRLSIWDLVDFQNSLVKTDETLDATFHGLGKLKPSEKYAPAVKIANGLQIVFAPETEYLTSTS